MITEPFNTSSGDEGDYQSLLKIWKTTFQNFESDLTDELENLVQASTISMSECGISSHIEVNELLRCNIHAFHLIQAKIVIKKSPLILRMKRSLVDIEKEFRSLSSITGLLKSNMQTIAYEMEILKARYNFKNSSKGRRGFTGRFC